MMLRILAEGGMKPFLDKFGGFDALVAGQKPVDMGVARPRTLAEKILSEKAGYPVNSGDIILADVDLAYLTDTQGPLTLREMTSIGLKRAAHPERFFMFMDHGAPSPRAEIADEQKYMRERAEELGARVFDIGYGVCHQVALEELTVPGGLTIGSDSHSCTTGALGSFATGMGATDVAVAVGTGKTWLRVPETIEVRLHGNLPKGVYAKDIALELERIITVDGATYKVIEYTGDLIPRMSITERATLSNMAVELGAKAGLFPSDEQTFAWMKKYHREDAWRAIPSDEGAPYERTFDVDVSKLVPLVACPHQPDNVKPISEVKGTRIHEVFFGACTNARLDDLAVAAAILKGRQVHPSTRLIVVPASRIVLSDALKLGYIQTLVDAGAAIAPPGCGACAGHHMGIIADGENVLSTQNRNFKGRMGNPNGNIYLSSPAVAAATALFGEIADPREVL